MSDHSVYLKCIVVLAILAWFSSGILRWMDDYYKRRFLQYLQEEKMRNPNLEVPKILDIDQEPPL